MSRATTGRRALIAAALVAFLVGAVGSSSAPAAHPEQTVRDLDLAASANPTTADPTVGDFAFANKSTYRREVTSDVTATGSAICDSCHAASTALQVLYVDRGHEADLDNTAVAWTQGCVDCTASALSVQIVVLRGVPSIVPNNRALALNAACAVCQANSLAYQVVVSSRRADRLSDDALYSLRAWVRQQAAVLRNPPPPPAARTSRLAHKKAERRAQRAATSALGDLEDLVTADVGGQTVSADVERGE